VRHDEKVSDWWIVECPEEVQILEAREVIERLGGLNA
jgi:hypothetical protein